MPNNRRKKTLYCHNIATYVDARFIACIAVVIQLWGEGRLYE